MTNVNLKDLITALPRENEQAQTEVELALEQLQEIFADLAERPVPIGSLQRLWTAGELSTQVALAYLVFWIRQWFADADHRQQLLMETNLRVALKMIHRLGYLRGAAAKIGQALGNLPAILPSQVVETLDRLHYEAPPMHFALLREALRNELGGDPDDIFESFQREPFAAASIGQVHRARLKSGVTVAVKIQYPGIARTIDADFKNLGALLFPARLTRGWDSTKRQFDEIHRMLKLEIDYMHEAENMRRVRTMFHDEGIVVPRIYDEYSTPRILTMEYLSGMHLREFLATNPAQVVRNRYGLAIYRAWARMYKSNINYADPHSGNYLFMDDGRLGLLDFGCLQIFNEDEQAVLRTAEQLLDHMERLPEVLRRSGADERLLANQDFLDVMRESCNWALEPLRVSGPFDFGDENHFKRGADILARIVLKRYTQGHPVFVYWNRSILGLRSLMYQLSAQIDLRALNEEEQLPCPRL